VTPADKYERARARAQAAAADVEHRYQRVREAIRVRVRCGTCHRTAGADLNDWPVLEGLLRRELGRAAELEQELEVTRRRLKRARIAAGRAQSPGEESPMGLKLKNAAKIRPTEPPAPPPPPPPPVDTSPPTVAEVLQDLRLELADMRDHTGNVHTERLVEVVDRLTEVVQEALSAE
jgi:hypothetical protein